MPKGTKFEVGKKYRCTTGVEVECVYAYDDNFYHCMFGKVLRRSGHGGNQIGDYDKFSGDAWSEIVPPPPPVIRFLGLRYSPKGATAQIDYHSHHLENAFDDVFRIEHTEGDDLPTVTRVK